MARSGGGGLPWKGGPTFNPGASDVPIPDGQYKGAKVAGDPDLVSGNIKSGVTIFGVSGDPNVINTQTTTPAAAGDIKSGKVAFANGDQITGSFEQEVLYDNSDVRVPSGWFPTPQDIGAVNTDKIIASATLTLNKTSNVRVIALFVLKVRLISTGTITAKIKRGGTTLASQTHQGTNTTAYTLTVLETNLAPGTYTWDAVANSNDSGNDAIAAIVAFSWVP